MEMEKFILLSFNIVVYAVIWSNILLDGAVAHVQRYCDASIMQRNEVFVDSLAPFSFISAG